MRTIPLILLLGFLSGCAHQQFTSGRGDVGQFIIKRVLLYGGTPLVTNDLPHIGNDWRYSEDANGIGIRMPYDRCGAVEQFFQRAFGPADVGPRQGARFGQYMLTRDGCAIQFTCDRAGTQVIVLRPGRRKESR